MSTHANIIIKDDQDTFYFYKHSDGYPEEVMPTLKKFLKGVKEGHLRNNAMQSAGWLIVMGHAEYSKQAFEEKYGMGWKVGAYEPTTCIHEGIEYVYTLDLVKLTIEIEGE